MMGYLYPILSTSLPDGIRETMLAAPLTPKSKAIRLVLKMRLSVACIAKKVMKKAFVKENTRRRYVKISIFCEETIILNASCERKPTPFLESIISLYCFPSLQNCSTLTTLSEFLSFNISSSSSLSNFIPFLKKVKNVIGINIYKYLNFVNKQFMFGLNLINR